MVHSKSCRIQIALWLVVFADIMVRVAVVTGGNRGLGLAIVRKLCEKFHGVVILTARDEQLGMTACQTLKQDGLHADFYQVDITNERTVEDLKNYITAQYGGLDVLVNNAGIYHGKNSTLCYSDQVNTTVDCDYFGLRNVCKRLFPLLRPYARVVNISSRMGKYSCLGPSILSHLSTPNLTEEDLDDLMNQFKRDIQFNKQAEGWPKGALVNSSQNSAYCVTKLAVTILTKLQADFFKKYHETREGILVNAMFRFLKSGILVFTYDISITTYASACCPGWLQTRLGGSEAPLSPEQGADTPVYLALLPPTHEWPNGKLLFERKIIPFVTAPYVRLPSLTGNDQRKNDVTFCGTEAQQHVIFFPGDVQDYVENMSAHQSNKAWIEWNLESTAKLLARRFPNSFVWVVKSSRLHLGTYACYDNFVETSVFGVPDHSTNIGAVPHLRRLLDSAVRKVLNLQKNEPDVTEEFPITLVGFSHGCVVLNQIVHELPDIITSEKVGLLRFISRINTIHWLDAGHNGPSNTWVTDERLLGTLSKVIPRIRMHVTPYQIKDKFRAWIGKEHAQFKQSLESQGANVKSRVYFDDQAPSLYYHFKLLENFEPAL